MEGIISSSARISNKTIWAGRVITAIVVLFMLFDSITKILRLDTVVKASAQLGYSANTIMIVGFILLACLVVYLYPRTAIPGAVLLTGYLGGAVEANIRIGTPLFSNILFPVYFGILVWAGLYLRNRKLRILLPFNREDPTHS